MPANGALPPVVPAPEGAGMSSAPSAWVRRFAPLIPPGEVLDLACGSGRHSRLLTSLGYQVCALDRDAAALDALAGPGIHPLQFDLENGTPWPFAPARFAGVVVTHYLHRPLFPTILASVAPGGVLIYETFASGNEHYGKPANPDFLLRPGELLDIVRNPASGTWRVVAFEDGYVELPKPAMLQRICVIKTDGVSGGRVVPDFPRIF
jgi:SAM-dependent methyltransferase